MNPDVEILNHKKLIQQTLNQLSIPHTNYFIHKTTNDSFNSLKGIERAFQKYKINTLAVSIDFTELAEAPFPAIVVFEEEKETFFGVLLEIKGATYKVWLPEKEESLFDPNWFAQHWTGVALLLEKTENSGEPNYKSNLRKQRIQQTKKLSVVALSSVALGALLFNLGPAGDWLSIVFALLHTSGIFVTALLVNETYGNSTSTIADFCSLGGKRTDCSTVLRSKYALLPGKNLWGNVSWSEVGLVFFIGSFLGLLLSLPTGLLAQFYASCSLLAYALLPGTFLSIYAQGWLIKKWCPFCLLIALVLWVEAWLLWSGQSKVGLSLEGVALVALPTLSTLLVWSFVGEWWKHHLQLPSWKNAFQEIKSNPRVFQALWEAQPYLPPTEFPTDLNINRPVNPSTELLVVLSAHCSHCASAFRLLTEQTNAKNINLTIRFHTMGNVEKTIVAIHQNHGSQEAAKNLTDWYESGFLNEKSWIGSISLKYALSGKRASLPEHEVLNNHHWIKSSQINRTPFFIVNDRPLPEEYAVSEWLDYGFYRSKEKTEANTM